jgi:hypothetical protein
MSLSGLVRAAWVAVPAAWVAVPAALVCGGAVAQQIITVPPGMVLVLTPGEVSANAPVLIESRDSASAQPIERIFAEQDAMMRQMMADMNAMFSPTANSAGLIQAMVGSVPVKAGTFCEESMTVSYNGHDSKPIVKVNRSGNGCGPATGIAPAPAVTAPPVSHGPKILDISAPAATPRVQHRT